MAGRLRIQHRIVIPFALIALVTTSAAAFAALSLVSRTLESRVTTQVQNAAAIISQSNFALNAPILRSASLIAGADIVTYTVDGTVLATTLDESRQRSLIATVATPALARLALATPEGQAVVQRMPCAIPCVVAYARVAARAGTVVAVMAETAELTAATRAITRTILLGAALSLVVMILVSQAVARRVTAPLDALVAFAREVSPVESAQRAPVGDDEIGRLAAAFNEMLDRLARSRDALVRSEKLALAGLMAARVAHDIRNPLSSMKMQSQLLGACLGEDAESRVLLDAILRDIQQLESVVRDLIELARPGALTRRPRVLNDVVLDILRQLSPQLTYRKIAVAPVLADGLPLVNLDTERFRQVVLNVIGNAADAMPTGGTLMVSTSLDGEGGRLVLDISDDGVGIDPAVRDRVFDPFVSTKRDGVGLGLVNAKAVIESHDGTVELTPLVPKGTRARIRLPFLKAPHVSESPSPERLHG